MVAQEQKNSSSKIEEADCIYQGEVIEQNVLQDSSEVLYVLYKIKVGKIYKGLTDLKKDTLEIIEKAPSQWTMTNGGEVIALNDLNEFQIGVGIKGVFVCKRSGYDSVYKSKYMTLQPICKTSGCFFHFSIESIIDEETRKVSKQSTLKGFGLTFEGYNDFENHFDFN